MNLETFKKKALSLNRLDSAPKYGCRKISGPCIIPLEFQN